MKRQVSLYVAGQRVDLDDDSLILFNHSMTDLTNPTIVKNSYSHQVTLKGTPTNNKLFGDIFRLDRQTIYSDGYTGVNFDPMRKTPFEIYDDTSTLLESGYIKLNNITRNGADIEYKVSLFGGLGSFIYGLSYNEDGSEKALIDLLYPDRFGDTYDFHDYKLANRGDYVYRPITDAWDVITGKKEVGAVLDAIWDIFNFAPAYNGLPKDFDANKAIHVYNQFTNSRYQIIDSESQITYNTKSDAGDYVLSTFTHDHTEWELRDLRWYLQRPVISFKKIIDAICLPENNGGYTVELDETFFVSSNPYFSQLWMTLPMIATEDRVAESPCLSNLLKATNSPAEYLLSYVKMFGLVIRVGANKTVRIMRRDTLYGEDSTIYDLTNRLNRGASIEIDPLMVDARKYQLGGNAEGQFVEEYAEEYGVPYGVQRIDTGYEFNAETKSLTDSVVFREAAEVLERNRMFIYLQSTGLLSTTFPLPGYEAVETELWGTPSGGEEKSEKFRLSATINENSTTFHYNNPDVAYGDYFSKVQLHKQKNDPMDGGNVLLFYAGEFESPNRAWLVTQDVKEQGILNGDKPCWNLSPDGGVSRQSIPMFQRYLRDSEGNITYGLEYGVPLALGIPNVTIGQEDSLYASFWSAFLKNLYDGNASVMKCKVNLRGLPTGIDLLGKLYWYENSLWILNKVSNLSITTMDDAECEFIKIANEYDIKKGQAKFE